MDWHASGIRNTFEYELIDPFDLDFSLGFIDGVTGCKITETYRGDYRSSASITLDGAELPTGALVRVWHTAELDGETVRQELGTFMQELDPDMAYSYGRKSGAVSLQSTLMRLGTDKRGGDVAVSKSKKIIGHFKTIVEDAGGTPYAYPFFSEAKTFSKAHVWECSESVLSEAQKCADAIGGYIVPDSHGRVCLVPYQLPSLRSVSYEFPSGDSSPVLVGLKCSNSEVVNRVVVSYKHDDVTYYSEKRVDVTHPWHWRKIGRHATKEYSESSLDELLGYELGEDEEPTAAQIQKALDSKADSRLAENTQTYATWSASVLYAPVSCGEVVTLPYNDSPDSEGLFIKGVLTQREITCDASMLMQITIEEV